MATHYGLQGVAEAIDYLCDDMLRPRLVEASELVAEQLRHPGAPIPLVALFGGSDMDAVKVVSSMTLFGELARRLRATELGPDLTRLAQAAGRS